MHPRYPYVAVFLLIMLFANYGAQGNTSNNGPVPSANPDQVRITKTASCSFIAFTKNVGQWPDSILFRADLGQAVMWLVKDGIYYQFIRHINASSPSGTDSRSPHSLAGGNPDFEHQTDAIETWLIKAAFVDANPDAEVVGLNELAYTCNYFLGNDPAKWRSDVPNYAGISFKDIYPGVDATLRNEEGRLTYELIGSAQAIVNVKEEYYGGVDTLVGGLTIVKTNLGEQQFAGMLPVIGSNQTLSETAANTSSGSLTLAYSTYLGGNDTDEGNGIAVDSSGCAYVTGGTFSTNFPIELPYQSNQIGEDVFISKLSATGSSLIYSTFVGGDSRDAGSGIAVDGEGNTYVCGSTASTDFPAVSSYQTDPGDGKYDVFVLKVSPSGNSLTYSTYIGGSSSDYGKAIAVGSSGNAYVTGYTYSNNFPTQSFFQSDPGDNQYDAFVTKLSAAGSNLIYSTYLGGNFVDEANNIAVDDSGAAYVTGWTQSTNFPIESAYQTSQGLTDVFVTKLAPSGSSLLYSTYLGGFSYDYGQAIAVDLTGNAYVTGWTDSDNFPTQLPFQTDPGDEFSDAFVTKIAPSGDSLVYSTYLGGGEYGSGWDYGQAIAVDGSGTAHVAGGTASASFPLRFPYQSDPGDNQTDVFITKLTASGDGLEYSTYLGGDSQEGGFGIALDVSGAAYVTGWTGSADFPTQSPFQTQPSGTMHNVFVSKLIFTAPCCLSTTGNVDATDIVNLSDLSLLVAYLTVPVPGKPTLPCPEEANIDASGIIDLTDLSLLVAYLTVPAPNKPTLPNCP